MIQRPAGDDEDIIVDSANFAQLDLT